MLRLFDRWWRRAASAAVHVPASFSFSVPSETRRWRPAREVRRFTVPSETRRFHIPRKAS